MLASLSLSAKNAHGQGKVKVGWVGTRVADVLLTYPIPFIQGSSLAPAAVLPVLELGHAGAGGAEHLRAGCHE